MYNVLFSSELFDNLVTVMEDLTALQMNAYKQLQ